MEDSGILRPNQKKTWNVHLGLFRMFTLMWENRSLNAWLLRLLRGNSVWEDRCLGKTRHPSHGHTVKWNPVSEEEAGQPLQKQHEKEPRNPAGNDNWGLDHQAPLSHCSCHQAFHPWQCSPVISGPEMTHLHYTCPNFWSSKCEHNKMVTVLLNFEMVHYIETEHSPKRL